MSSTAARSRRIDRPANAFRTLAAALSIPMALLVPLWAAGGRVLFGVGGQLTTLLAFTLGPVLFLLLLLAGVRTTATAAHYRPFAASAGTSAVLACAWLAALGFGFTVPDFGDRGGSVMSRLLGEPALGVSTALCNPLGIISVGLAIASVAMAYRDARRTARLLQGLPEHAPED
ncbi:hypothetical protein LVY72_08130 [Arthrobacter sp. I2-34]|uniref:Uncharacterized protein n=1 Tax=Arthrobacter hankyongi TaxID=2904801 RepID=A0ABS9L5C5_9MICC|nr:hypothetical protein [Arthrobacter hankyongi]MCG2621885.1 hypothetical protein [Arthrobacter hankyongi]